MSAVETEVVAPVEYLGHYPKMTNDEYHEAPGTSKSHLDIIVDSSPLHYWDAYVNPDREPRVKTPALITGEIIHAAMLEPELFEQHYVVSPKFDRRFKDQKEAASVFAAKNIGRNIVEESDYTIAGHIRDAAHRHPVAGGLLRGGISEQTFFAKDIDTEALIKCKTDYFLGADITKAGMIVDLKSSEDAGPRAFFKSIGNYRYDVQQAWYRRVRYSLYGCIDNWAFLAFEKVRPFAIGVYYIDEQDVAHAAERADRDFRRILDLRARDEWPDYGSEIIKAEIPAWSRR